MRSVPLALLLCALAAAAAGQELPDERAPSRPEAMLEQSVRRLFESFGQADNWAAESEHLMAALERVFERNGWDTEADRFSLELAREVSVVPPWQLRERFDVLGTRLADRYALTAEQDEQLRRLVVREWQDVFARHAGALLPVVFDAFQSRLAGEPFTPEQIQRWSRVLDPVFEDGRQRFDAAAAEFMDKLTPEQQELALADVAAANRRLDRIKELGPAWWRGEWDPADWGLDEDPIQRGEALAERSSEGGGVESGLPLPSEGRTGAERELAAAAGRRPVGGVTSRPAGGDDPWAEYVREFIRRYGLDAAQQQRAWIIHDSACERRDFHGRRYERRREQLGRAGETADREAAAARLAELEQTWGRTQEMVFETLRRRLDRLPTRSQRANALPPRVVPEPGLATRPVRPGLGGP